MCLLQKPFNEKRAGCLKFKLLRKLHDTSNNRIPSHYPNHITVFLIPKTVYSKILMYEVAYSLLPYISTDTHPILEQFNILFILHFLNV